MILEVIILPFNFQLPLMISDHIIETLNHNNTYEDSSNPGEDEFFHLYSGTPLIRPPLGHKNPGRNNEVVALTGS